MIYKYFSFVNIQCIQFLREMVFQRFARLSKNFNTHTGFVAQLMNSLNITQ